MITAEVILPGGIHSFADVNKWLMDNVGPRAKDRDCVTDATPWATEWRFGMYEYYFARKTDATMFTLRWAS
jgi:hypothetical protein